MKKIIRKRKLFESNQKFFKRVREEIDMLNNSALPKDGLSDKVFWMHGWGDADCKTLIFWDSREQYMMLEEKPNG